MLGRMLGLSYLSSCPLPQWVSEHYCHLDVTFQARDVGRMRIALKVEVEKKGSFWEHHPHMHGEQGRTASLLLKCKENTTPSF